jgi:hypothetical protein
MSDSMSLTQYPCGKKCSALSLRWAARSITFVYLFVLILDCELQSQFENLNLANFL